MGKMVWSADSPFLNFLASTSIGHVGSHVASANNTYWKDTEVCVHRVTRWFAWAAERMDGIRLKNNNEQQIEIPCFLRMEIFVSFSRT